MRVYKVGFKGFKKALKDKGTYFEPSNFRSLKNCK